MSNEIANVEKTELPVFDYGSVDENTAGYLKDKTKRITDLRIKSILAMGKELKEVQSKLANYDHGTFLSWIESIGLKKDTVYRNINAYEWVFANCENLEDAGALQQSLLYAVSKKDAPEELQKAVLKGDIKTHKEYQELLQKFENTKKAAEELGNRANDYKSKYEKAEGDRRTADKVLKDAQADVKMLQESLEKARQSAKDDIASLQAKLVEAENSSNEAGDSSEVERLEELLQQANEKLVESNDKISVLQNQLKSEPIEASASTVKEVIPKQHLEIICNSTINQLNSTADILTNSIGNLDPEDCVKVIDKFINEARKIIDHFAKVNRVD